MAWDDDSRAEAIKMYEDANPTAETSVEIVGDIADQLGQSKNGVRMILSKAGVYIKKEAATKSSSSTSGTKRVSQQDSHDALIAAISDTGQEPDTDIISKLSGKAAQYMAGVLTKANEG